ncbi:hypothetical protein J6590_024182, partial [Homalodisca vitripennis]
MDETNLLQCGQLRHLLTVDFPRNSGVLTSLEAANSLVQKLKQTQKRKHTSVGARTHKYVPHRECPEYINYSSLLVRCSGLVRTSQSHSLLSMAVVRDGVLAPPPRQFLDYVCAGSA